MITLLIYLVIIGVVWFVVDKYLLQPYAAPMIRTIVTIVIIIAVLIWLLNAFGLTNFHPHVKS